jgi:hypothetical protein
VPLNSNVRRRLIPMTTQIPDTVVYENRDFSIADVNGSGLFTPDEVGLSVQMMSTACYRGYYCQYTVRDNLLYLTKLTVCLSDRDASIAERGEGPFVFGQKPKREPYEYEDIDGNKGTDWGDWFYDNFEHRVPYNGGLLLGGDWIDTYRILRFSPDLAYRNVYKLTFQSGVLLESNNISTEVAEKRLAVINKYEPADTKINSVKDLLEYSQEDLLEIKNFGAKSAEEVIEALQVHLGITLPLDKADRNT